MDLFIARQAILDERLKTFAYELLFRSGFADHFDGTEGTAATIQVISNSFLSMGAPSILGGRRGFMNFPRSLILDGSWQILPRKSVVIEILEDVEPDNEVLAACRSMKSAGYSFALDENAIRPGLEPLIEMAEYVKIDLQALDPDRFRKAAAALQRLGVKVIAEKVETRAEYDLVRSCGVRLFQGYFFTRPVVVNGREVPGNKMNYVRILRELQQRNLRMNRIEELVRCELSLAHRLLRYVNSALFEWKVPIETVQQAFLALGEDRIRRWLLMTVLPGLALDSPSELVLASLVRARSAELLAERTGQPHKSQEWFMMGLFSLMDSILNRPLSMLIEELNLAPELREALLGGAPEKAVSKAYSLIRACESADWEGIANGSQALNLAPGEVGTLFTHSLSWADQMFGNMAA